MSRPSKQPKSQAPDHFGFGFLTLQLLENGLGHASLANDHP